MSSIPDSAVARRGDDQAAVGREYWIEVACAGEALPRRPLSFVEATANTTILRLSGATTPTISDWRVMDLELDGLSLVSWSGSRGWYKSSYAPEIEHSRHSRWNYLFFVNSGFLEQ